jgi:hypothetical protein
LEVSKAYQVRANNVYKWIDKYSLKDKNGVKHFIWGVINFTAKK